MEIKCSKKTDKTGFLLVLIFIIILLPGCQNNKTRHFITLPDNWSYALGNDGDSINAAINYQYSPLEDSSSFENLLPKKKGVIWLRQEFTLPGFLKQKEAYILADKIIPNNEIYINSLPIGKTGQTPDRDNHFFSEWNSVEKYRVDRSILKQRNKIYIRIYVFGEGSLSEDILLGTEKEIDQIYRAKDFSQTWLNLLITSLMIFVAFFYAFIYFNRKEEKDYLYFAIAAFALSLFQSNFYITKLPINLHYVLDYFSYQKFIFLCLHIQAFFFIKFFHAFTGEKRKKTEIFFLILYGVPLLFFLFIPDFPTFLMFYQYQNIILGLSLIIYVILRSVYLLRKGHWILLWLFFGVVPGLVFVVFDIVFHNILNFPGMLYLGFLGTPVFILSMSFLMGLRYAQAQNESEILNKTLEKQVLVRTEELLAAKEELEVKNKKLEAIAHTDPLSTLYNRRYFLSRLHTEFSRDIRYSLPLSLIMVDIDYFKKVNDNYGHPVGDKVISGVSRILKNKIRASDLAARFGGEEFCILLPSTSSEKAVQVAEKLRKAIGEKKFSAENKDFFVTASFGVTGRKETDKEESMMITRADKGLYRAKETGRNRVCLEE